MCKKANSLWYHNEKQRGIKRLVEKKIHHPTALQRKMIITGGWESRASVKSWTSQLLHNSEASKHRDPLLAILNIH